MNQPASELLQGFKKRSARKLKLGKLFFRSEEGQSMMEFALILPILLLLLLVPVDFYRVIDMSMQINDAAVDGLNNVQFDAIKNGTYSFDIVNTIDAQYGKKIDVGQLNFTKLDTSSNTKETYTYYVYSSDRADESIFQERFDERPSSYEHCKITMQLSYKMEPITFWGVMFLGDSVDIESKVISRDVYAGGYIPAP